MFNPWLNLLTICCIFAVHQIFQAFLPMPGDYQLSSQPLTLTQIEHLLASEEQLSLSAESIDQINHCRQYLDHKLAQSDQLFYGINTGFGALCNIRISADEVAELQKNLVQSHACGTGEEVPHEIVRLMLLLKIKSLSLGHSAVRLSTIEKLLYLYNHHILPVIYQQGSLGASGDLAPLAHLSLPLLGLGWVNTPHGRVATKDIIDDLPFPGLDLQSKEGLALLNGTQFSAAYACWCTIKARRLLALANLIAAISIDAFDGQATPFDERLHRIRPHKGQMACAAAIRSLLHGSEIINRSKAHVQDPYAFRCVPQVHGASQDAIEYVAGVAETEMNAVTDNPNIFPDDDSILSGGNFHAQPLALSLDFLAIALAELGNISERRTYQLISGQRGLPAFLIANAGLHSGFMIPQYTAASIVSQNKQLCTPASVDSIVSSNGQEDHVSMAANAATKAWRVVKNVERVLAIELMTAAQAMHFRKPLRSSATIEKILAEYRMRVPPVEQDRVLSTDIHTTIDFIESLEW